MNIIRNSELLKTYNCCVIIAAYANSKNVSVFMEAILEQTEDILIINDGTTYETLQLLEECIDIKKVQVL